MLPMGLVFLTIMLSFILMVTGGELQKPSVSAIGFALCTGALLYAPIVRFISRFRNRK